MTDRSTIDQLGDILDWAALLPALLTRHAPTGDNSRGGRASTGSRPPARLDVMHVLDTRLRVTGDDAEDRAWHDRMAGEHRQGLLPDLYQWARLIEAEAMESSPEVPDELPEDVSLASVAAWLLTHLDWALTQRWSVELVADVDWWWRRLRHLAGERDAYQPRCPRCMFPIEPVISAVDERTPGMWRCVGCGTETSVDAGLKRLAEPVVTTGEAAAILGVTDRTVRYWARDLLPINPGESRPRYLLRDMRAMTDKEGA